MEKEDIKKLVLQAAQGNRAAFGALYEETGRTVYFSCLKLLGDPQLAEDITQETYLTALQKLGTLAQPENFPAWVNRIGINLCKMHFRNNAAPEDNSEEIIEDIPDEGLIPEEYVSNDAKRKIIMDIIDTVLTEEQRRSVILYYFDMLTVPEIAEVMNCTTGTVTSRLSAARKKIKEAVLIYEENNNDRLHAAVPVFILSKLLSQEASNTVLPKLTVFTGSASATDTVPDSVTSTKTISGGKGMFSTVKAKVIAGVCAVAVVGGGITAAVMANRNSDEIETDNDTVFSASSKSKSDVTASKTEDDNDTNDDNNTVNEDNSNGSGEDDTESKVGDTDEWLMNTGLCIDKPVDLGSAIAAGSSFMASAFATTTYDTYYWEEYPDVKLTEAGLEFLGDRCTYNGEVVSVSDQELGDDEFPAYTFVENDYTFTLSGYYPLYNVEGNILFGTNSVRSTGTGNVVWQEYKYTPIGFHVYDKNGVELKSYDIKYQAIHGVFYVFEDVPADAAAYSIDFGDSYSNILYGGIVDYVREQVNNGEDANIGPIKLDTIDDLHLTGFGYDHDWSSKECANPYRSDLDTLDRYFIFRQASQKRVKCHLSLVGFTLNEDGTLSDLEKKTFSLDENTDYTADLLSENKIWFYINE